MVDWQHIELVICKANWNSSQKHIFRNQLFLVKAIPSMLITDKQENLLQVLKHGSYRNGPSLDVADVGVTAVLHTFRRHLLFYLINIVTKRYRQLAGTWDNKTCFFFCKKNVFFSCVSTYWPCITYRVTFKWISNYFSFLFLQTHSHSALTHLIFLIWIIALLINEK